MTSGCTLVPEMEPNGKLPQENDELAGDVSCSSSHYPEQKGRDAKATTILEACKWKDIATLRKLAISEGGLVSDNVRRLACSCYLERFMNQH